jgi:hypothetical protein
MGIVKLFRLQWDRATAIGLTGLGLLVLLLGYLGTAGTPYIAEQIPYLLSGGLFAIILLTVAAVLWLSADLKDEWRELAEQSEAIRHEQLDRRQLIADLVRQEVASATGARRPSRRANADVQASS